MGLFRKQRVLSIMISLGLLAGILADNPVYVYAEALDPVESSENAATENGGSDPDTDITDVIQENTDEKAETEDSVKDIPASDLTADTVSAEIADGTGDEILDEVVGETFMEVPDKAVVEISDEDSDETTDETPDEVLDETPDETLNKGVEAVSDEDPDGISRSVERSTGLSIAVDYPNQITCKVPTNFTVNASGGSGDYQYRIHSIMTYENSEYVSVYDVSYGSNSAYQDSNVFPFTFHASGTYYIRFSVRDKNTNQYKDTGFFEHTLNIQDPQYPSVDQIVNSLAAECTKTCTTDFEKALWLHDWILDHADYDYSYSYCSAEGVLARGEGTCESYHRAYVMLLNKVGIATGRIEGNGHVWTAVKMDGKWYQVDTTWDDMGADFKGTYYEHMYFGLTDDIIGLVHSDHKTAVPGYESTALENNYFIKTGEIKRWSEPFEELVRQNIDSGKTSFSLSVTDSDPDNFKNVLYNLVAYQLSNQDWGKAEVSASYKDNVITVKTEVKLGTLLSLTITPPAKTVYEKGEAVDTAGLTVTANYENGSKRLSAGEYQIEGFETGTAGTRTATVTFGGKRAVFRYTVQEKQQYITVYKGIDYSAVYDYTYYISNHDDLKQAFGNDQYKALEHFVNSGMAEGRQGKASFNVNTYRNRYADLRNAFGNTLKSYYMHYITSGLREGRNGSGSSPMVGYVTLYNGIDYSPVYDYNYYIGTYGDIAKTFANDENGALRHFVLNGMSEGRQGKSSFNVNTYKSRYADLRKAFGNDLKKYYLHYINSGIREGRSGSGSAQIEGYTTVYQGVDYSSVYDYNYYLATYADLKKAFNNNEDAALQHFVLNGMSEGRQGKKTFNVNNYKKRYSDLQKAFGNNLKNYYLHYINSGIKEGRDGR